VSKNATCVNDRIEASVLGRSNPCFGNCSVAERDNRTSDCWIDCVRRLITHRPAACLSALLQQSPDHFQTTP